mmetsp:Transcript_19837/g.32534  ORF Transcript_19837/g.32534 Transcript_19837/m.32534 type:complete len:214 (-) Transcript_19837:1732-2373(-)
MTAAGIGTRLCICCMLHELGGLVGVDLRDEHTVSHRSKTEGCPSGLKHRSYPPLASNGIVYVKKIVTSKRRIRSNVDLPVDGCCAQSAVQPFPIHLQLCTQLPHACGHVQSSESYGAAIDIHPEEVGDVADGHRRIWTGHRVKRPLGFRSPWPLAPLAAANVVHLCEVFGLDSSDAGGTSVPPAKHQQVGHVRNHCMSRPCQACVRHTLPLSV